MNRILLHRAIEIWTGINLNREKHFAQDFDKFPSNSFGIEQHEWEPVDKGENYLIHQHIINASIQIVPIVQDYYP